MSISDADRKRLLEELEYLEKLKQQKEAQGESTRVAISNAEIIEKKLAQ
jgi:hypothetical protein